MTGFARIRKVLPQGELIVSVKSVNHRGLDLHFHLPPEMDSLEPSLRSAIKRLVARGHLQIHAIFNATDESAAALNRPLLAAYLAAFRAAAAEFGVAAEPDLNVAMRLPGIFRVETRTEIGEEVEAATLAAMEEALEMLAQFREREGKAIAEEMRARCAAICESVNLMEEIRASASAEFHKRMKERLRQLLRGAGVEPQRLAQEAAILADRSDVSEELMRLRTHAAQIGALLDSGGEAGKKLDFLLQEMNRESNTILSKTSGLGELGLRLTDLALGAKAEVDKIREQSLNLE